MGNSIPLSLLRIWCNQHDCWLSFVRRSKDRYLIGPKGYFLELPDGCLVPIRPQVAFVVIDQFAALQLDDIELQSQFGKEVRFISVNVSGPRSGKPHGLNLADLQADLDAMLTWRRTLPPLEQYLVVRLFETGLIKEEDLRHAARAGNGSTTIGESLIDAGICSWEFMLTICLDIASPSKLDPPGEASLAARREWELIGEILVFLGRINRTSLEQAYKLKRDGSRALGQILISMGACSAQDIVQCLGLQRELREALTAEIALVGQLLVAQGVIASEALEDAIRHQRIGRQALEKILLAMGVCRQRDIDDFVKQNNWHSFQSEIDDKRLGEWLVKIGTITRQQFDEAIRIQMRGRQVLGELLTTMQLCSPQQMEEILSLQKRLRAERHGAIEKLGVLLLKHSKVDPEQLQAALKKQSVGRQPLGCILVGIGACSAADIEEGLDLQLLWRQQKRACHDRLGEVLVAQGVLTMQALEDVLPYHFSAQKPLGQVLVERHLCTPEQIINALLFRDHKARSQFLDYLQLNRRVNQPAEEIEQSPEPQDKPRRSPVGSITSWLSKHRQKS